jgi:spore coat polysaccharide biosynthesis protein SpsF (cytidylyltransferase family)
MNKDEMEHVTKYFYNNSRKFKIKNFKSDIANYSVNLCIDTIEDFKSLTKKYKKTFIENINNYEN